MQSFSIRENNFRKNYFFHKIASFYHFLKYNREIWNKI